MSILTRINRWRAAWIAYGLLGLAIEGAALKRSAEGDTLSEQVWAFTGRDKPLTGNLRIRRTLFVALWGWASLHLLFRWD